MLFMLKQQHFTLSKVRTVKSYFTTPLTENKLHAIWQRLWLFYVQLVSAAHLCDQ